MVPWKRTFRPTARFLAIPLQAFWFSPSLATWMYLINSFKVLFQNGSNADWDPFVSPACWAAEWYPSIREKALKWKLNFSSILWLRFLIRDHDVASKMAICVFRNCWVNGLYLSYHFNSGIYLFFIVRKKCYKI